MIKYGEVKFKQVSGTDYELIEAFTYEGEYETFNIPAGFRTDFATVPTVLQWLAPKVGPYNYASLVHDYLCETEILSGADTDGIFRRLLRECGVGWLQRNLMWVGVRIGSLGNKHRQIGWHKTLPRFIAFFLLAIPLVLPPTLLAAIARGIIRVIEWAMRPKEDMGMDRV